MKEILRMYVRKQPIKIDIPANDNKQINIPISAQFHIHLSENDDKDVIEWIKSIRGGYRNGLIKNITRSSINGFLALPYFYSDTIIFSDTKGRGNDNKPKKTQEKSAQHNSQVETQNFNNTNSIRTHSKLNDSSMLENEFSSDNETDDSMDIFESMLNSF